MDPDLLTAAELAARGRVVIHPCKRCHHNEQIHVNIPRMAESGFVDELPRITSCLVCECYSFLAPGDD